MSAAARFAVDLPDPSQDAAAEAWVAQSALANAAALVEQASALDETPLPFAALDRLNARLRADPLFAPIERGSRSVAFNGRAVAIEQSAPRTSLWAVDAALGHVLTACGVWARPLPCPGAVTAEVLQPQLSPGERGLLAARSLYASVLRLCDLVAKARRRAALMAEHLSHLRASARAPQVWTLLAGFAPLGLDQIGAAFAVSRRGTYAIGDALVTAGMARRETGKGKVLLVAQVPRSARPSRSLDRVRALPSTRSEFNAAMAKSTDCSSAVPARTNPARSRAL